MLVAIFISHLAVCLGDDARSIHAMWSLILPRKIIPRVATDPAPPTIVLVLNTKATAIECIVILILWGWKADPPHGSSGRWLHHSAMLLSLQDAA